VSAESLEVALGRAGVTCTVESRDRLAVIVPAGDVAGLADDAVRRQVLLLAREHGFTHVAVELIGESPGAPVLRD
jgi:hypothetical protein